MAVEIGSALVNSMNCTLNNSLSAHSLPHSCSKFNQHLIKRPFVPALCGCVLHAAQVQQHHRWARRQRQQRPAAPSASAQLTLPSKTAPTSSLEHEQPVSA